MTSLASVGSSDRVRGARSVGLAQLAGWTVLVGVGLLARLTRVNPGFAVDLVGMSVMLTGYGLIAGRIMSGRQVLGRSLATLKLGPWFGMGFAIVFGLMSLVWLQHIRPNYATGNSAVLRAGWIALVGLAAFTIGYVASPKRLAVIYRPRRLLTERGPSAWAVVALWLLALASQSLSFAHGALGYLSPDPGATASTSLPEVLALFQNLGFLATLLSGWRLAQKPTAGARFLSLVVVASQIGLSLFSGLKEPALIQMTALFIGYASVRRIKSRWVLMVLAGFVLLVVPFVTLYRAEVAQGGVRLSPAQALAQISFGSLAQQSVDSSASQSWTQFATRLSRIGDVAIIVQKTPGEVPDEDPLDLVEAPVLGLIPRTIWPDKPVLDGGAQMARIYYDSTSATSAAVTPEGDLWKHGGFRPLLLGMLVFGAFVSVIDRRVGEPRLDPRVLFLPMLLFSAVVKEETDFVGLVAGLATTALLSALATWLVGLLSPTTSGRLKLSSIPSVGDNFPELTLANVSVSESALSQT